MLEVEIDRYPSPVDSSGVDWLSLLLARQLSGALFLEQSDGSVAAGLIADAVRVDSTVWHLEVSESAAWTDGDPITSTDIRRNFERLSTYRNGLRWILGCVASVATPTRSTVAVTTRYPIGDLAAMLASPYFGLRGDAQGRKAGSYSLTDRSDYRLLLTSNGRHPDLQFQITSRSSQGLDLFRRGELDITSATTLDQSVWADPNAHSEIQIDDLRIAFVLVPPKSLAPAAAFALGLGLDRDAVAAAANHAVVPRDSLVSMWDGVSRRFGRGERPRPDGDCRGPVPLYYTDFAPNLQVATELARQLTTLGPFDVQPRVADYGHYLSGRNFRDGFQLMLTYCPWPNPASMFCPTIIGSRCAIPEVMDLAVAVLDEPDPERQLALARQCESGYRQSTGDIVIGQLRSGVLSRVADFRPPPSGWIDYSTCTVPAGRGVLEDKA